MGHHKRGRTKNRRAGCLLCKPHKSNGVDAPRLQELRARASEREQLAETKTRTESSFADGASMEGALAL